MRLRYTLVAAAFALLAPLVASAQPAPGAYMKWDQCAGAGGVVNKDFACDTNTGYEQLVVSFVPPFAMPQLVGIEVRLDYVHADFIGIVDPFGQPPPTYPPITPWWQFQTGGCRAGFAQASPDFGLEPFQSTTACANPWSPAAIGGAGGVYPLFSMNDRGRISAVAAMPETDAAAVDPEHEYYGVRVLIRHNRSVGVGACDGCCTKTVLALASVGLYQPAGVGDVVLSPAGFDAVTSWQFTNTDCLPTPTRTRTWGQVKSLYR